VCKNAAVNVLGQVVLYFLVTIVNWKSRPLMFFLFFGCVNYTIRQIIHENYPKKGGIFHDKTVFWIYCNRGSSLRVDGVCQLIRAVFFSFFIFSFSIRIEGWSGKHVV
jgi:hypothetical protein